MKLQVSPLAEADIDTHAAFIANDRPREGERFLENLRATFDALVTHPGAGRRRNFRAPELDGLRSKPVAGFPNHLVFYLHDRERVLVLRVLHGAMDLPRVFKDRRPKRGPKIPSRPPRGPSSKP